MQFFKSLILKSFIWSKVYKIKRSSLSSLKKINLNFFRKRLVEPFFPRKSREKKSHSYLTQKNFSQYIFHTSNCVDTQTTTPDSQAYFPFKSFVLFSLNFPKDIFNTSNQIYMSTHIISIAKSFTLMRNAIILSGVAINRLHPRVITLMKNVVHGLKWSENLLRESKYISPSCSSCVENASIFASVNAGNKFLWCVYI